MLRRAHDFQCAFSLIIDGSEAGKAAVTEKIDLHYTGCI